MIEHQEGSANFLANLSGKDKGPGKIKGVFYNPSMKFSRDLNVELLKELDEFLEDSGVKLKDAKPSKIEEKQHKIDILKKVKTYLSKIEIVLPTTAKVIKFIKEIEAFDFDISSLNNTQSTLLKDN